MVARRDSAPRRSEFRSNGHHNLAKIWVILIFGPLLLSACNPVYTYRYKLTVKIEESGFLHTASNVVEISEMQGPPLIITEGRLQISIQGQANSLTLESGRTIYTLLDKKDGDSRLGVKTSAWTGDPTKLLCRLYGIKWPDWNGVVSPGMEQLVRQRGAKAIGVDDLPDMVTFANPLDPMSVRIVDPVNLEEVFGANVHFVGATIEVTDEPVSRGIEKQLPWLSQVTGLLDGTHSIDRVNPTLANTLEGEDFRLDH